MRRLAAATLLLFAVALPAGAATKAKKVTVGDDFFSPSALTVKKNTKVKWIWKGDAPHDVTVTSGPQEFRSELMSDGKYARKLKKKGTYELLCTVHAPDMTMTITVK